MAYGNPTQAQIDGVTTAKQGTVLVNRGLNDYIYASGMQMPEHSDFLAYQYPQYQLTSILERIQNYEGTANDVYSWGEMGRTRKGATITAGAGAAGATLTLTTDIPAGNGSDGYFIIGDILITEKNKNIRVTAVGAAGGFQTITVAKVDGTAFIIADLTNTEHLGHSSSAFEEYSDGPKGRLYLPNEDRNCLQTIRRVCSISGKARTQRTYYGESWMYEQEKIEGKEFAKDRENAIMFGEFNDTATQPTTEGINTKTLSQGVLDTFTGTVTEAEIRAMIVALKRNSNANEFVVFCGLDYMAGVSTALRDYSLNGAVDYGTFAGAKMAGINFDSYKFLNTTVHFVHYNTFDDSAILPYTGTGSATKINYSNYALWLNMKSMDGQKNIVLKYKENDGIQRKMVIDKVYGTGVGAKNVSNLTDGEKTSFLSEIGAKMVDMTQHGVQRAIG